MDVLATDHVLTKDATFCLQLEASIGELFYLQLCLGGFFHLQLELFSLQLEFFYLQLELFAYSGKVPLRSAFMDRRQRSSIVSKTTPTVCEKDPPLTNVWILGEILEAQQRYFSYHAIRVAIVSQNSFVLVLMGYTRCLMGYRTDVPVSN